ncbi:MAG: RCC1 domain-containing protein [Kofleriaceae bacterium]
MATWLASSIGCGRLGFEPLPDDGGTSDGPVAMCEAATCPWGCFGSITCDAPVQVDNVCAVRASGRVVCWGNSTGSLVPVLVDGITDAVEVSVGQGTCARRANGAVVCWGSGGYLGDGTNVDSAVPVAVVGVTDAIRISSGGATTCAVRRTGSVTCWGNRSISQSGACGTGGFSGTIDHAPRDVAGISDAVDVSVAGLHACVLRAGGQVACWGANQCGQLGNGTTTFATTPVAVSGLTDTVALGAGLNHTCAIRPGGVVSCWGDNRSGQLGDGGTTGSAVPIAASQLTGTTQIMLGHEHTCALRSGGAVTCRGLAANGRLGTGPSMRNDLDVLGLTDVVSLGKGAAHAHAIRATAELVGWGANGLGQLGDNSTVDRDTPVAIGPP